MQAAPFRFKQFSVAQDRCAMKVNTDGVLLGAWQDVDDADAILDIGTGTGVIALMMAQRNARALINAIDIDEDACVQAVANFRDSPWAHRLQVYHSSLQAFMPGRMYDLIVSNPPYFTGDYQSGDARKNIARHSVALTYEELLTGINRLLSAAGRALLILPAANLVHFQSIAGTVGLYTTALTEVAAIDSREPYVVLIQLEREQKDFSATVLTIQNAEGTFTDEYKALTKNFYLKF